MATNLKRSELARCLGVANASISMAVKNGLLVPNKDKKGTIDIDFPTNKLWIDNQVRSGKTFDLNGLVRKPEPAPKPKPKKNKPKPVVEKIAPTGIGDELEKDFPLEKPSLDREEEVEKDSDVSGIAARKAKADAERTEEDARIKRITRQKLEGKLIPVDAAQQIFLFAIETFRNKFIQKSNNVADIYSARLGATHAEYVEVKKELIEEINLIEKEAKEAIIDGLQGQVEEYKEVRSRGEKK